MRPERAKQKLLVYTTKSLYFSDIRRDTGMYAYVLTLVTSAIRIVPKKCLDLTPIT